MAETRIITLPNSEWVPIPGTGLEVYLAAPERNGRVQAEHTGEHIRHLRICHGISQSQLADMLCMLSGTATLTRHEVSRWERGERRPLGWRKALAATLGVPESMLVSYPDPAEHSGGATLAYRERSA